MSDIGFDVSVSVISRNRLRLVVKSMAATGLVLVGFYLLSKGVLHKADLEALESLETWEALGTFLIFFGFWVFIGAVIFLVRSIKSSGVWHFRLDDESLTWDVPRHFHGEEVGFRTSLSEIKEIEERYIQKDERPNETEYWIHFKDKPSIQLQRYSGFSLTSLTSKIADQGVKYSKRTIDECTF
jgi:hypothetical protein